MTACQIPDVSRPEDSGAPDVVDASAPSDAAVDDGDAGDVGDPRDADPAPRLPHTVELDPRGVRIDGEYTLLRGGSFQYFRIPEESWDTRLGRFAAAGFNVLDIYIPWNVVEPLEGQFDFTSPNLSRFLSLAEAHGLWVVVRPGPFITNEMDGGGLPAWLTVRAGKNGYEADGVVNIRTHDPDFIEPVRRYFRAVNEVLRPHLATEGGNVILYTIENEYNWFESFFSVDKAFWHNGGFERPLDQAFRPDLYMAALRDIVRESGVDIPIVTCPGNAEASATGDVADVVPFPNVYEWATPKQPEEAARDLRLDMHNPEHHGGVYVDYPTGSLEVNRSAQQFRRLFMGGMDALFGFNMAGMIQEGRLNAMTLGARLGDQPPHWGPPGQEAPSGLDSIFDPTFDNLLDGFVSPKVGFFHNVLDYEGAMGPSGLPRELYYQFRRDNLFYSTVERHFAGAGTPSRGGDFEGASPDFVVRHPALGSREYSGHRAHYFLEAEDDVAFLGVLNQSGEAQVVSPGGISFRGRDLPEFVPMTVPVALESNPAYMKILTVGLPLVHGGRLAYSTSELLTQRDYNGETLLVLYDVEGAEGEVRLEGLEGALSVVHADDDVTVRRSEAGVLVASYRHSELSQLLLRDGEGRRVRVVLTTRALAGRVFFASASSGAQGDVMWVGPDAVRDVSFDEEALAFTYETGETPRPMLTLSPFPIFEAGAASAWDAARQVQRQEAPAGTELVPLDVALVEGRAKLDMDEVAVDYDDSDFTPIDGAPQSLEHLGIYRGHAFYRAELELDEVLPWFNRGRLYVPHASDIVGIYVNGHYLSTVVPVGTEIDSHSFRASNYRFASPKPYLKQGKNVIVFRTEIWGHGSFMFPKGTFIATGVQMPGVGYEGMKGLFGEATLAGEKLTQWRVRAGVSGEAKGYAAPDFEDHTWDQATLPWQLEKGTLGWYRTTFDTAALHRGAVTAPVALTFEGERTKATLYLNGRLIGRWLSGDGWLAQGGWGRPERDMWVANEPDRFPLPEELLRTDGVPNVVAVLVEDTSHSHAAPGVLRQMRIGYNDERYEWRGGRYHTGPAFRLPRRVQVTR